VARLGTVHERSNPAGEGVRIRRLATAELTPAEIVAIRDLLWTAFPPGEEGFTEADWEHALGGVHVVLDLGGALAYWIQSDDPYLSQRARRQPTHLPGMPTRREVVEYYCDRAGVSSANWAFYEVFGLFRLAAIAQQIYYRYHHKQTRNPAFRQFWLNVNYLVWRAHKAMR